MAKIRKQVMRCGKMLEVSYFPTHEKSGYRIAEAPKSQKSKEKMREENRTKSIKNFVRMINTNFDEKDFYAAFDYQPEFAPLTYENAMKDIVNYINRVKYHRKKKGLSNKNFRYAYSVEEKTYKSGLMKGRKNYHFHMFMTSDGMTASELKALWSYGTKGNITNYDPYRFGPEAAARYMTKCHSGKKMYKCSKNMKKPVIEDKKDGQISESKLRELGEQRVDDREYWEKKYPSYNFVSCKPFHNQYNGHWYITVIMYKKDTSNSYYARQRKKAKPNFTYANIR